jgi:hypothetical protein
MRTMSSFLNSGIRLVKKQYTVSMLANLVKIITIMLVQWDAIENKSSLLLYGGGAVLAVWISLVLVRALDSVPLVI